MIICDFCKEQVENNSRNLNVELEGTRKFEEPNKEEPTIQFYGYMDLKFKGDNGRHLNICESCKLEVKEEFQESIKSYLSDIKSKFSERMGVEFQITNS